MKLFAASLTLLVMPLAALAEDVPIPVPSGQTVTYFETIQNAQGPEGLTYRFRFIAPAIARDGGTIDADTALLDMEYLCNTFALGAIPSTGPQPAQIVVSLADRPVPFGEPAPEATQFFEAFRPEDGSCIWEGF
ncbi:DUF6497 family protein [Frigidibacter sp. RF13]|uniref:DUF6497 family protein n=1 Tax=Frigidibacter sp. RF13 TaxID=2997340 RepID=UPI002270CCA8|nr:DUF6497 family protein [Frigidibacter sp. RF13]MCY1127344.1 DUF6497 family protein [Frigidibacter sp. RF13]